MFEFMHHFINLARIHDRDGDPQPSRYDRDVFRELAALTVTPVGDDFSTVSRAVAIKGRIDQRSDQADAWKAANPVPAP